MSNLVMPEKEDKQKICDLLLPALQATRNLYDLIRLNYEAEYELVIGIFANGSTKTINVARDSATAMIKDIISNIV